MLLIIGIVSILLGGSVYYLFRPDTLVMFAWVPQNLNGHLLQLRDIAAELTLADWVVYSLPNLFWMLSYALIQGHILRREKVQTIIFWISVLLLIAILSEVFQALGWLPGTFDTIDIFFYFAGAAIGLLILNMKGVNRET